MALWPDERNWMEKETCDDGRQKGTLISITFFAYASRLGKYERLTVLCKAKPVCVSRILSSTYTFRLNLCHWTLFELESALILWSSLAAFDFRRLQKQSIQV